MNVPAIYPTEHQANLGRSEMHYTMWQGVCICLLPTQCKAQTELPATPHTATPLPHTSPKSSAAQHAWLS
jgi:hypothetical protein